MQLQSQLSVSLLNILNDSGRQQRPAAANAGCQCQGAHIGYSVQNCILYSRRKVCEAS